MSRTAAFPGSLTATKTGYTTRYVRAASADIWRKLGYTVDGTTDPNPVPYLKEPGDITTMDYGASWNLDHDGLVDWHSRVREWNGYGTHIERSLAGSYSQNVAEMVCGSYLSGTKTFWTPGDADIVFLQSGIGLDQDYDTSDGRSEPHAYDNLTCILATLEGGARTEVTTGGTGTWANSSTGFQYSGGAGSTLGTGTWRYTTTEGDSIDIAFTGPAIDISIGTFNGTNNGLSADTFGRPCIVRVDGVTHSSSPWATDNRVSLEADHDTGHRMVRLRNLGEGAHTVTLEAGAHAQAGAFLAVDYWVQPVTNPPIVCVLKEMWLSDWASAPAEADYDAVMAQFDAAIADNRTYNPRSRVVVADLTADFPSESYWDADKLHPEQLGFDWIGKKALKALLQQGPYVLA